jgi:osmotically-inducible protein OsmY
MKADRRDTALFVVGELDHNALDFVEELPVPQVRPSFAFVIVMLGLMLPLGTSLSGCVVAAVGGTAAAGYSVFAEDLPPEQQLRDVAIKAQIKQSWGAFNQALVDRIGITVFDGDVLITGRVPSPRWRNEAVRRAWRIAGVKQVFNEVTIGPDTHFIDAAHDEWITTELRGMLIADINVKSINYVITTFDRVVYLMGVARNQAELNLVINHARTVAGVRRVISFVRLLGTHPPPLPPGEPPPPPPDETPPPSAVAPPSGQPTPLTGNGAPIKAQPLN